jgi:hypothetical protein
VLAQGTSTPAQSPPQRDQQALAVLTQTITAAGGQQLLASIQDFTEIGTVTYAWDSQAVRNVTVKGRGLHQLKIDADLPDGQRTAVVSNDGGSLTESNGTTRLISQQSANDLGSLSIPYIPLIAAMQDPTRSIIYGGLVTHNGVSVYDIRLRRVYTKQEDATGNRGVRETRDFYIDPNTFLVTSIADEIHAGGPNDNGIPHEILYSNYQSENGIAMPLTISETAWNVTGFTMQLSQVEFNSGLSDSDFAW